MFSSLIVLSPGIFLITPLDLIPPKKTSIENPESIGVLSNDKEEGIAFVDHQDQTMVSVPQVQAVEDRQVQAQGRRLVDIATFEARCDASVAAAFPEAGLSGSDAYVDCVGGFVRDTTTGLATTQSCADACGTKCCTGDSACGIIQSAASINGGFTGKGEQFGKE